MASNIHDVERWGSVVEQVLDMEHWADPEEKSKVLQKIQDIRIQIIFNETQRTRQLMKDHYQGIVSEAPYYHQGELQAKGNK